MVAQNSEAGASTPSKAVISTSLGAIAATELSTLVLTVEESLLFFPSLLKVPTHPRHISDRIANRKKKGSVPNLARNSHNFPSDAIVPEAVLWGTQSG